MQKELNSSENSKFIFVYICIFLHSFVFIVVSAVLLQGKSNNKKQFIASVGIFFIYTVVILKMLCTIDMIRI